MLHGLEKKGYLRSSEERKGKSFRKIYRATPLGRKALKAAKSKVRELFGELIEGEWYVAPNVTISGKVYGGVFNKAVMLFLLLIFAASTLWAQGPPFQIGRASVG